MQYLSFYNLFAFTEEAEKLFKELMIEAVSLGLPHKKLEDFSSFLAMDFLYCQFDLSIFKENNP